MEVNDFKGLNTTELFDDSNDSFDKNEKGNDSETIVSDSDDDNFRTTLSPNDEYNADIMDDSNSSDAEELSTVVSSNFYLHTVFTHSQHSNIRYAIQNGKTCS